MYSKHFQFQNAVFILTRMLFFQETIVFGLGLVSTSHCQPKHFEEPLAVSFPDQIPLTQTQNFLKLREASYLFLV